MEVERLYGDATVEILHGMCRGVHDVARCEECKEFQGGKCGNLMLYEKARGDDSPRSV